MNATDDPQQRERANPGEQRFRLIDWLVAFEFNGHVRCSAPI